MKLVKFSVTNFRSILEAQNIPISNTTVLVGKNNEGKSNLLKALSIAMEIIRYHARHHAGRYGRHTSMYRGRPEAELFINPSPPQKKYPLRFSAEDIYKWNRDFPISKKLDKGRKQTILKLEFQLNDEESDNFKKEFDASSDKILPLRIAINAENHYTIEVAKGSKVLNANTITRYITERISFNYIPAVRTHEKISEVIDELLSYELSSLEDNSDYKKAEKIIDDLEKPILDNLSKRIKKPLSEFLPNIKKVTISTTGRSRDIRHRRKFDVEIDDGTSTSIKQKGDGVQSLATLGLLKNRSRRTGASIIAIEEPESHLHSGAIHQLQKIIESLESDNQIVLTTHNPLFVNTNSMSSNIIVDDGKANKARDIKTIRDVLGVRVSDNLTHARFILIVEGKDDKESLRVILPTLSKKIGTALANNHLIIHPVGGANNLSYQLSILKSQMCLYHVFADYDGPAKKDIKKSIKDGVLTTKNLTQTICDGMAQSEFEDCINPDIYKEEILKDFKVNLDFTDISKENKKWSDRVKKCFLKEKKPFDKDIKQNVKNVVASCIKKNPSNALCKDNGGAITKLAEELKDLLESE